MKKYIASAWLLIVTSTVFAGTVIYEGFGYGDVSDFVHNVANTNAAGGVGFTADGWKQYNANAAGLVSVADAGSIGAPSGYSLSQTDGFMRVGGNTTATWALRNLSSGISANADTEYWFSYAVRNNDNAASIADSSKLAFRDGGATMLFLGFDNDEQLQIQLAGQTATGNDPTVFEKGNNVTILAKLVLSSSGTDTLYVSAFDDGQTIEEPTVWDLSVSADLGSTVFDNIGFNVNSGNSRVDLDEIRVATEVADVIPEPATLSMLGVGGLLTFLMRWKRRLDC